MVFATLHHKRKLAYHMPTYFKLTHYRKFKLYHYPSPRLLYFYFRFLAPAPSLLASRASKKE